MKLSAKEISAIVEGTVIGDAGIIITGAAGLDEASSSDISFLGNKKYQSMAGKTNAGILFSTEKVTGFRNTTIQVKNPQLAFAKILSIIEKEKSCHVQKGVHETAVVGSNVKLGNEITVGANAVIEDNVNIGNCTKISSGSFVGEGSKIGHGCLIYPNVTIGEKTIIGKNVIIHAGTVLGSDGFGFVPREEGHFKIPQIGIVEIGDDVEIGSNTSIDRATVGKTKIGKGTKIDNLVHIAHNVEIGEHCIITGQNGFAGSSTIGDFVTFGAQGGVAGHLKIGAGATVAARAGVISDVKPKETVSGFPARAHREEMKIQALIHKLPDIYKIFKKKAEKTKK
ncbi:UDP-3-O-(3-hydroxymyristoyl)glucosamine N-acyltransferase [Elusimicrobiota bacterium]